MAGKSRLKCSVGNLKIGKDTVILNITSATDCESLKRGLCQVPEGKCYALRAEKQYPPVLPYRRKQTRIWDSLTAEEIAEDVKAIAQRPHEVPIRYLRMQEAGDFRDQADVNKTSRLADLLRGIVTVYTYTARRDLDYRNISSNLIVNGSGFMVSNNCKVVGKLEKGVPACRGIKGGGCYGCTLCKTKGGKVIQEILRSPGGGTGSVDFTEDADEHGGVAMNPLEEVSASPLDLGVVGQGAGARKTTKKKRSRRSTAPAGFRGILD